MVFVAYHVKVRSMELWMNSRAAWSTQRAMQAPYLIGEAPNCGGDLMEAKLRSWQVDADKPMSISGPTSPVSECSKVNSQ